MSNLNFAFNNCQEDMTCKFSVFIEFYICQESYSRQYIRMS